jgi:hypothetical protein
MTLFFTISNMGVFQLLKKRLNLKSCTEHGSLVMLGYILENPCL